MCELDKLMKKGKVPGYTSAYDFLEDKSHLNGDGKYVEAVTFFATIYKEAERIVVGDAHPTRSETVPTIDTAFESGGRQEK